MSRFNLNLSVIVLSVLLSACESSPKLEEDVAPVEERTQRPAVTGEQESIDSGQTAGSVSRSEAKADVNVYPEGETYMPPLEPLQLANAEPPGAKDNAAPTKQYKTGPAAQGLLDQASKLARAGKADQAAGLLERALRIEPSNPWLWHRLAVLRLQQKLYKQSIDLARKSISLASGDRRLQAGNWQIIARANEAVGDVGAAREARSNAKKLTGA